MKEATTRSRVKAPSPRARLAKKTSKKVLESKGKRQPKQDPKRGKSRADAKRKSKQDEVKTLVKKEVKIGRKRNSVDGSSVEIKNAGAKRRGPVVKPERRSDSNRHVVAADTRRRGSVGVSSSGTKRRASSAPAVVNE